MSDEYEEEKKMFDGLSRLEAALQDLRMMDVSIVSVGMSDQLRHALAARQSKDTGHIVQVQMAKEGEIPNEYYQGYRLIDGGSHKYENNEYVQTSHWTIRIEDD